MESITVFILICTIFVTYGASVSGPLTTQNPAVEPDLTNEKTSTISAVDPQDILSSLIPHDILSSLIPQSDKTDKLPEEISEEPTEEPTTEEPTTEEPTTEEPTTEEPTTEEPTTEEPTTTTAKPIKKINTKITIKLPEYSGEMKEADRIMWNWWIGLMVTINGVNIVLIYYIVKLTRLNQSLKRKPV